LGLGLGLGLELGLGLGVGVRVGVRVGRSPRTRRLESLPVGAAVGEREGLAAAR
jgi:hypothetical protein